MPTHISLVCRCPLPDVKRSRGEFLCPFNIFRTARENTSRVLKQKGQYWPRSPPQKDKTYLSQKRIWKVYGGSSWPELSYVRTTKWTSVPTLLLSLDFFFFFFFSKCNVFISFRFPGFSCSGHHIQQTIWIWIVS